MSEGNAQEVVTDRQLMMGKYFGNEPLVSALGSNELTAVAGEEKAAMGDWPSTY